MELSSGAASPSFEYAAPETHTWDQHLLHQSRLAHAAAVNTALQIELRRAIASQILARWTGNVSARPASTYSALRHVRVHPRS